MNSIFHSGNKFRSIFFLRFPGRTVSFLILFAAGIFALMHLAVKHRLKRDPQAVEKQRMVKYLLLMLLLIISMNFANWLSRLPG